MPRSYPQVVRLVFETPWAVLPSALGTVLHVVYAHVGGEEIDEELFAERRAQVQAAKERAGELSGGGVAVLPVYGVITPRADMMTEMSGGTSAEVLTQQLRAVVAMPEVGAIVLDVDSPGGMVGGVPELAAEIRAAREKKPVFAVANTMAASAAYWLASQATELAVQPSAEVGSIGVFAAHEDVSGLLEREGVKTTLISAGQYKTEGNPWEPLSDDARAAMQEKIDGYYDMFIADVAAGRGVGARAVRTGYGQGRMLQADPAVQAGMADRVATLEETVARAFKAARRTSSRNATRADLEEIAANAAEFREQMTVAPSATNIAGEWIARPSSFTFAGMDVQASGTGSNADRPGNLAQHEEEIQMEPEPQETEPTVAPQPRQGDPARDELLTAVAELTSAVKAQNEGRGDPANVERLQDEVVDLRNQLDKMQPSTGFTPDDVAAETRLPAGVTLAMLHEMPAKVAAARLRRPEADVREFRETADALLFIAMATGQEPRETKYFGEHYLPALAAIDTLTTAEGKEFVPTLLSSDLIQRVELDLRVAALFRSFDMPSNPYEIPGFALTRVRSGRALEQTADTGQTGFKKITPGTRKISLSAVKFAGEILVSKEEQEDSLIPIIPFLRDELTSQLAFDIEDALINGDTAGSHQDADVVSADDPRKVWDGLRKLTAAGQKTDGSAAVIDSAKLRVNRKKMGKYGVDSSQLVHLMSIAGYVNALSDPNVLTVDKYGPNAVILNGELAKIDGIPIVVSQFVRDNLNATGFYDSTVQTKTVAITVNPRGFVIGNRRSLTLQVLNELYAEYDQTALAVTMRKAFAPVYPTATEPTVSLTYNVNN